METQTKEGNKTNLFVSDPVNDTEELVDASILAAVFSSRYTQYLTQSNLQLKDYLHLKEFISYCAITEEEPTELKFISFIKPEATEASYKQALSNYLAHKVSDYTGIDSSVTVMAAEKLRTSRLESITTSIANGNSRKSLNVASLALGLKVPGGSVDIYSTLDRFGYDRTSTDKINLEKFKHLYATDRSHRNFTLSLLESSCTIEQEDFAFSSLGDYLVFQASEKGYDWSQVSDVEGAFKYDVEYDGYFDIPHGYGCRSFLSHNAMLWKSMELQLRCLEWGVLRIPRLPNHKLIVACGTQELIDKLESNRYLPDLLSSLDTEVGCELLLYNDIKKSLVSRAIDDSCASGKLTPKKIVERYDVDNKKKVTRIASLLMEDGSINVSKL